MSRQPRLLVLNQYYKPGVEATANLLADLCEALVVDYDVTVVTGRLAGRPELPDSEVMNGVRVLRTRSTTFDRTKISQRGVNYVTYLADTIVRSLSIEAPSLLLCMTDPPIVGDLGVALARRFHAPLLVISEDVFPEIATELDRLTNPVVVGVLRRLVAFYLRRADHIVAIGERMRLRLIEKGAPPERISVIPNWVDAEEIKPMERDNPWSVEHGLAGRFAVMHSGNVGHAQDLDNLVRASTFLRDLDDLVVPIVGFGARHAEIRELSQRLEADKVALPAVPTARGIAAVARECARSLRRARERPRGLRRAEPPVRDPRRGAPGDRRGGPGQRDRAARLRGRLRRDDSA